MRLCTQKHSTWAAIVVVGMLMAGFTQSARANVIWTPDDLGSNLSVWLDGKDSSTLTVDADNRVSQWDDKSGNENHVAASGSERPTLVSSGVSSMQSLAFAGRENRMLKLNPTNLPDSSYTATVVYQYNADLGGTAGAYALSFGVNQANRISTVDLGQGRFVHHFNDYFIPSAPDFQDGDPHFYVDRYTNVGDNESLYYDGEFISTVTLNNPLDIGDSWVNINGYDTRSGGSFGHQGYIGEVIIVSDALGDSDRQLLEGYLAHKWYGAGDANPLPSDHPYKNIAVIPEPASLALLGVGGLMMLRRRKR